MKIILTIALFFLLESCNKSDSHLCAGCEVVTFFPDIYYDTSGVDGIFLVQQNGQDKYSAFANFYHSEADIEYTYGTVSLNSAALMFQGVGNCYYLQGTYQAGIATNWQVSDTAVSTEFAYTDSEGMPFCNFTFPTTITKATGISIPVSSFLNTDTIQCVCYIPDSVNSPTFTRTPNNYGVTANNIVIDSNALAGQIGNTIKCYISMRNHHYSVIDGHKYLFTKESDTSFIAVLH